METIRARISGISYSGGLILVGIILLPLYGLGLILLLLAPIWVWYLSKSFELSVDDKSVRFRKGFLSKNVYSMAIRQIESIELRQSFGGRLFKYGALRFHGTGASNDYTPNIKDPEAFKSEVERRMQAAHAPPPQYSPPPLSQHQPPLPPSMGTEGSSPAPAPAPTRHPTASRLTAKGWAVIGLLLLAVLFLVPKGQKSPDSKATSGSPSPQVSQPVSAQSPMPEATPESPAPPSKARSTSEVTGAATTTPEPTATTKSSQLFVKKSPTPKSTPTPKPFKDRSVGPYKYESDFSKEDIASANTIIGKINWSTNGDLTVAAAEDVQQFLNLVAESDKYQTPGVYNVVAGQAAQSYGGVKVSTQHVDYIHAWNKAIANGPAFKNRPVAVYMTYWADEAKKAEIAAAKSTIDKIKWSLSPDSAVAAAEDAKQFVELQGELKASLTNNVYNMILDSAARPFKGPTDEINYQEYVKAWREVAGFGPEIKSRSVTVNPKAKDFADEPKADIAAAQAFVKKIKWSLNPKPVAQAAEDAEQFLKLAEAAKTYPNYNVSSIVWWVARDTSNELPSWSEYSDTWNKIVGGNETDYMTRILGEQPKSTWLDGGIRQIGDIIIRNMNDPKSYKFDSFTVSVGKYKGTQAWKVDYYFRGKNAFGAIVLNHIYAYMRNGEVIGIEQPND